MKRFFILATAAIVALASCAKTEVVYKDAPEEIAFKKITGAMTKADPDPVKLVGSMGVFAWTTESTPQNYFGNTPVEFTEGQTDATPPVGTGIWHASPAKYYPLQTSLDFACFAPYSNDWTYNNTEKKMVSGSYTSVEEIDVLFGEQIYANCNKNTGNVPVVFKHAVSKVSVKVATNVADMITIKSVTLTDLVFGGTFTVDYNESAFLAYWEDKTAKASKVWGGDLELTSTAAVDYGSPIYFISGNYGETDSCEQTAFVVEYELQEKTFTAEVDLSTLTTPNYWEMGKHYIYTINANLTEITFAPKVEVMADVVREDLAI